MSKIQVSARMKIRPGMLEEFKLQADRVYQASEGERPWDSSI